MTDYLPNYDTWKTQAPEVFDPEGQCEVCGNNLWRECKDDPEPTICDRCSAELDVCVACEEER